MQRVEILAESQGATRETVRGLPVQECREAGQGEIRPALSEVRPAIKS